MIKNRDALFNAGFILLNVIVLLAFCNLTIFYSFYDYLAASGISKGLAGIIIGVFSVSAIIIRPLISPILTPVNAIKWLASGLVMTAVALVLYLVGCSAVLLAFLRVLHGAGYVIVVSSAITLLMAFMPSHKSGLGFSVLSITTTIPFAIIPFVIETVFPSVLLPVIYAGAALFVIPSFILLWPTQNYLHRHHLAKGGDLHQKLPKGAVLSVLRQPRLLSVFGANVLLYLVFSVILFFVKTLFSDAGIGRPELFYLFFTIAIIASRTLFGVLFDRYSKARLVLLGFVIYLAGLVMLNLANSAALFYASSIVYGIGMGVVAPLLNGLMYSVTQPELRGLSTNLMLEMMDCGFFIGPSLCGLAIAAGFERSAILSACSAIIVMAILLVIPLAGFGQPKAHNGEESLK